MAYTLLQRTVARKGERQSLQGAFWTDAEKQFVIDAFGVIPQRMVGEALGRTTRSIQSQYFKIPSHVKK